MNFKHGYNIISQSWNVGYQGLDISATSLSMTECFIIKFYRLDTIHTGVLDTVYDWYYSPISLFMYIFSDEYYNYLISGVNGGVSGKITMQTYIRHIKYMLTDVTTCISFRIWVEGSASLMVSINDGNGNNINQWETEITPDTWEKGNTWRFMYNYQSFPVWVSFILRWERVQNLQVHSQNMLEWFIRSDNGWKNIHACHHRNICRNIIVQNE